MQGKGNNQGHVGPSGRAFSNRQPPRGVLDGNERSLSLESIPAVPAVTTLSERKQAEAARRRQAADAVVRALCTFARQNGGGFIVFGSYVTGIMRYDSDLDVMIDFPTDLSGDAWRFVEYACAEHGIKPDIHDAATSRSALAERVRAQGLFLP